MRRRFGLTIGVVAALLGASGCSGGVQAPAATVNGTTISRTALFDDVALIAQQQRRAEAESSETYAASTVASSLNQLINDTLIQQELRRRKLKVTADDTAQVEQYLASQQATISGQARNDVVNRLAGQNALLTSLLGGRDATKESVQQKVLGQPDRWFCLSYVQTTTLDDANSVLAEVAAGADFAKIVADNANAQPDASRISGTVDCTIIGAGSIPTEIEVAVQGLQVGQLSKPVVFAPGQVVVLRREVLTATNAPEPAVVAQSELQALVAKLAAEATVEVSPQFGRWKRYDPLTDGVQANGAPFFATGRKAVVPFVPSVVSKPTPAVGRVLPPAGASGATPAP